MNEYERKFRCTDVDKITQQLTQKGFIKHKEKHQVDTYFIVNKTDEQQRRVYLRIREDKKKNSSSLDYHIVLNDDTTKEIEVGVEDAKKTTEILNQLGQQVVCVVNKKRLSYKKSHIEVTIDRIDELGVFVEVEVSLDDAKEAIEELNSTCQLLKLKNENRVSGEGYPDLLIKHENNT